MTPEEKAQAVGGKKRYYYTNPLKAAWMAMEFGVRFWWARTHNGKEITNRTIIGHAYNANPNSVKPEKYYICPDSLPIFEPQWQEGYAPGDHIIVDNRAFFMPECEEV